MREATIEDMERLMDRLHKEGKPMPDWLLDMYEEACRDMPQATMADGWEGYDA